MRRTTITAAGLATFALLAMASPALAGYGALAFDEAGMKYGLSSNEETQTKADDVAMKECGGDKCKIVFRTMARQCGAVALADGSNVWGGGRGPAKAAAELDAMKNCQKRTKSQCKIKSAECNR